VRSPIEKGMSAHCKADVDRDSLLQLRAHMTGIAPTAAVAGSMRGSYGAALRRRPASGARESKRRVQTEIRIARGE